MPTLTTRTQSRRKRLWPWLLAYALLLGAAAVFAYMAAANFSAAVVKLGAPGPRLGAVQALWLRIALAPAADQLFAASSPDTAGISLIVESGELPAAVAKRIAALGLAPDAQLLLLFMIYKGYDKQMQAGYFKLSHSMPPAEIAAALVNAMPSEVRVRIWAGWRAGQVVASLAAQPHLQIDPSALLRMIDGREPPPGDYLFRNMLAPNSNLEGYLFPSDYVFEPGANTNVVLNAILQRFDDEVMGTLRAEAAARGFDLPQLVTLASIVEREAMLDEERPLIARVFLNRLAQGMPLMADPTTQYALAGPADWWPMLTLDPRTVDHPYNTYVIPGLPPGPIANPSLRSMQAVANPADSNTLYFRAACEKNSRHKFSVTYEEHLAYACP